VTSEDQQMLWQEAEALLEEIAALRRENLALRVRVRELEERQGVSLPATVALLAKWLLSVFGGIPGRWPRRGTLDKCRFANTFGPRPPTSGLRYSTRRPRASGRTQRILSVPSEKTTSRPRSVKAQRLNGIAREQRVTFRADARAVH
jgi:hypothetical protein